MKDTARRRGRSQDATAQRTFAAMMDARATLHEAGVRSGMMILSAMLKGDREWLCRPRYAHDATGFATRAGYTDGELAMGAGA